MALAVLDAPMDATLGIPDDLPDTVVPQPQAAQDAARLAWIDEES